MAGKPVSPQEAELVNVAHTAPVRVDHYSGRVIGRALESGEAVNFTPVLVRANGSWRPGVIHRKGATRTTVRVVYRKADGCLYARNFYHDEIRIPTDS